MITSKVITGLNCPSCWQYCCNANRSVCKQEADSLCPTWYANRLCLRPKQLLLHLTFTVNCCRVLFVTTTAYHWLCPALFIWHECLLNLGDVKDVVWHLHLFWKHTHHIDKSLLVHVNGWNLLSMSVTPSTDVIVKKPVNIRCTDSNTPALKSKGCVHWMCASLNPLKQTTYACDIIKSVIGLS